MAECGPEREDFGEESGRVELKIVESDVEEEDDEPLDPRVQIELENLNSAAESINKLENELQKARTKFRLLKSESSHRLSSVHKKIGRKWIIKARPYFDLLNQSHKAQIEAQKTAIQYQRANGVYRAAKETVTLAEQQLLTDGGEKLAFDSAWQEMLNHATMRFMDAEKEKRVTEQEHQAKASEYNAVQLRIQLLQKDMTRTLTKARPFYELKERLESRLHAERQNAEDLHLALICSKQKYKMALSSLEFISEDVHSSRLMRRSRLPPRTPGVGAESDAWSEASELPSANLDFMSETSSQASFEDFSDFDLDLGEWDDVPMSPPGGREEESIASTFWSKFSSNSKNKPGVAEPIPSSTGDALNIQGVAPNLVGSQGVAPNLVGMQAAAPGGTSPMVTGRRSLGGIMFGSSPAKSDQHLKPPSRASPGRHVRGASADFSALSSIERRKLSTTYSADSTKLSTTYSADSTKLSTSYGTGSTIRDTMVDGAEALPVTETKGGSEKLTQLERLKASVSRSSSHPLPLPYSQQQPVDPLPMLKALQITHTPLAPPLTRQDSESTDGSAPLSGKPPLPFSRVAAGRHSAPPGSCSSSSINSSVSPAAHSASDISKVSHSNQSVDQSALRIESHDTSNDQSESSSHNINQSITGTETSIAQSSVDIGSQDKSRDKSVPLGDEIFV